MGYNNMKEYDLIIVGTGSGMNYVGSILQQNPEMNIAVVDKDEPGGICLTRGCIPSKMLLYPAEIVREIKSAQKFGISAKIEDIDFKSIMDRMRNAIHSDIALIREGLESDDVLDYYHGIAQFIAPYTLEVGDETLKAPMIFLCTGSKPFVPPIEGLDSIAYLTSDEVLNMESLPESLVIVGAGYIAAEYGHFFSAMGCKVTVIGNGPRVLQQEEPEISILAKRKMEQYLDIHTGFRVVRVGENNGMKKVTAINSEGDEIIIEAEQILLAVGRTSNSDILHPDKGDIGTDEKGWIKVNENLETTCKNVWAFGDCNGQQLFKHVGNYESTVVFQNAILRQDIMVNYHAVPHAVFSWPEIAGAGLSEAEAIESFGKESISIGFEEFENTGKGLAMDLHDYFVKVIIEDNSQQILGIHIIGPQASVLIHQVIPLMYVDGPQTHPLVHSMDIHPSLSEVVKRAFYSQYSIGEYHMVLKEKELEKS